MLNLDDIAKDMLEELGLPVNSENLNIARKNLLRTELATREDVVTDNKWFAETTNAVVMEYAKVVKDGSTQAIHEVRVECKGEVIVESFLDEQHLYIHPEQLEIYQDVIDLAIIVRDYERNATTQSR